MTDTHAAGLPHRDSHDDHSGCTSDVDHDRNLPDIDLLSPLTIRSVSLRNRIVV